MTAAATPPPPPPSGGTPRPHRLALVRPTTTADDNAAGTGVDDLTFAERVVVGAMLWAPTITPAVAAIIGPGDYHHPTHGLIHAAITDLYDAGTPVDPLTVAYQLHTVGALTRVGGLAYLRTCHAAVPTPANATWYAHIVAERAQRRRLAALAERLHQAATLDDPDQRRHLVHVIAGQLATNSYDSWQEVDLSAVFAPPPTPAQRIQARIAEMEDCAARYHAAHGTRPWVVTP